MDIPSNNQLIPYYSDQRQLAPKTEIIPDGLPVLADRRLIQYHLLRLADLSVRATSPCLDESEYNSDRRLKTPKINQVGLLIDIYA
jgi:hypothetical protein